MESSGQWVSGVPRGSQLGAHPFQVMTYGNPSARRRVRERHAARIVDALDDAVVLVDTQWRVLFANARAEGILQTEHAQRRQLAGEQLWKVLPPVLAAVLRHHCLSLVENPSPVEFDTYYGPLASWFEVRIKPEGNRIILRFRDVTEQKRDQNWLRAQHRVLELVAIGAPLQWVLEVLATSIEERDPRCHGCIMLVDRDGTSLRVVAAPSLPQTLTQSLQRLPLDAEVSSCVAAVRRGQPVIISDIANDPLCVGLRDHMLAHGLQACWSIPIAVPSGRLVGTVAIYFEQSCAPSARDWEILEEATRLAGLAIERHFFNGVAAGVSFLPDKQPECRMLQAAMADAPLGLAVFDGTRGVQMNRTLAAIAATPVEPFPDPTEEPIRPSLEQQLVGACQRVRETGHPLLNLPVAGAVREPAGEQRFWLANCYPVRDDGGAMKGVAAMVVEITKLKQTEHALRRQVQELTEAVRQRDESLSIVAHEIKTPLTSLQLVVDSLLAAARNGSLASMSIQDIATRLEVAARQNKRLSQFVNKILDVTRISLGRLQLEPEDMDLGSTVRDVLARFREDFAAAGCSLTLRIEPNVVGYWDRLRIEQVVTNLVSNALKYGSGKPVEVMVSRGGPHAVLTVRDHGIGIEPEQQARIFDRFERAVSGSQYSGLGLGLYIVRQIVEAHGGTVRVESQPGAGATFVVTLPLEVSGVITVG